MDDKAWWHSRRFELGLALASVVGIAAAVLLDLWAHDLAERLPLVANIVAGLLGAPLLALVAVLVFNRIEQRTSETYRSEMERERLLRSVRELNHLLDREVEETMLLTEEVTATLRQASTDVTSAPVDWSRLSALPGRETLKRLIGSEPAATERVAADLAQISASLRLALELGTGAGVAQAALRQAAMEVDRAVAVLEDLLPRARTVRHGLNWIRKGRTWNGSAVVEPDGSGSFTLDRTDVESVADLADEARLAVGRAHRSLTSATETPGRLRSAVARWRRRGGFGRPARPTGGPPSAVSS